MALISLAAAKAYLHVDTADEDATIGIFLSSAEQLCVDVARLSDAQWTDVNSEAVQTDEYAASELSHIRELMKIAILYTVGYLYEHREKANYLDLTCTLRSLLFSIREGVV